MGKPIANGYITIVDLNDAILSGTAPLNPVEGTLWIDTSVEPNKLYSWDGSNWVEQTLSVGALDPDFHDEVQDLKQFAKDAADDGMISSGEKLNIKLLLVEITGETNFSSVLPTLTQIDTYKSGQVFMARAEAKAAGIATTHTDYTAYETAYNNLKTYLDSLNPKAWATGNTKIDKATWDAKWDSYYEKLTFLQVTTSTYLANSLKPGSTYNGVTITTDKGIVVLRGDKLFRTTLNATEGLAIEKNTNGTWNKVFYTNTDGKIYAKGLAISADSTVDGVAVSSVVSDVSATKTNVSGLQQNMNNAQTAIEQNKEQIALRATTKTVDDIQSTVSEHTSAIDLNSKAIEQRVTKSDLENLSLGGRNLLKKSIDYSYNNGWRFDQANVLNTMYRDTYIVEAPQDWFSVDYSAADLLNRKVVTVGKKYTLSVYARLTGSAVRDLRFYFDNSEKTNTVVGKVTSEWQRFSVTFDWIDAIKTSYMRFEVSSITNEAYALQTAGYQLEEGILLSDWTPAPEDLDERFLNADKRMTNAETRITQSEDSIKLKAEKSVVDQDISGIKTRMQDAETAIELNTDEINLRAKSSDVSEIDGRVKKTETDLKLAQDAISQSVKNSDYEVAVGLNKWMASKYNMNLGSSAVVPNFDHIKGKKPVATIEYADSARLQPFNADYYMGYYYTNIYVSAVKSVSITVSNDDGASIFLNGTSVYGKGSTTTTTTLFLDFVAGWNTIEILHYEHGGGEFVNLGVAISTKVDKMSSVIGGGNKNETRLIEAETTIKQTSDAVVTKAEKNNVYTKSEADGKISTAVNNAKSEIALTTDGIRQTVTDTNTKIDNLKIGGRNLLRNTKDFKNSAHWALSKGSDVTGTFAIVDDAVQGKVLKATYDGGTSWWVLQNNLYTYFPQKFNPGEEYTTSMLIKSTSQFTLSYLDGNGSNAVFDFTYLPNTSGEWKVVTTTQKAKISGNDTVFYLKRGNDIGEIQIAWVKLESGNRATDYTAAPEDVDDKITEVDLKASSIDQKADSIRSDVTSLTTTVNSQGKTISSQGTSISQLNSSITSKAEKSDVYTKNEADGKVSTAISSAKTEIKQTTDSITQSVTAANTKIDNINVGGVNILPSSDSKGGWTNQGIITDNFWDDAVRNQVGLSALRLSNAATTEAATYSTRFRIKKNTEYTLSFWYYVGVDSKGLDVFFMEQTEYQASQNYNYQNYKLLFSDNAYSNGTWKRKEITFKTTTTSDVTYGFVRLDNNGTNNGTTYVYLAGLKLEEGNKATAYSPSFSDIDTKITTVSNKQSQLEQNLDGFKLTVYSKTEADGKIADAKSQIKQTTDSITQSVSSVDTKVNNLSIGGRNLLTNSGKFKDLTGWKVYSNAYPLTDFALVDDSTYGKVITATGSNEYARLRVGSYIPYLQKKDRTLTFSMIYSHTGADNVTFGGKYSTYDSSGEYDAFSGKNYEYTDLGNGYKKMVCTVNLTYTETTRSFFCYVYVKSQTVKIAFCKLEEGDKATDWMPAVEDVDTNIDSAVSAAKSEIKQTTDSITQTVSTVNNKVDNLTIGGRNFIPNSKTPKLGASNYSSGTYSISTVSLNDTAIDVTSVTQVTRGASGGGDVRFNPQDMKNTGDVSGRTYTISAYCKPVSTTDASKITVLLGTTSDKQRLSKVFDLPVNKWTRVVYTYKFADTTNEIGVRPYFVLDYNQSVYMAKAQLEQGDRPTDWTSSPEDVSSDIASSVSTAKSEIKQTTDSISQSVGTLQSTVNSQGSTISNHTSSISQLNSAITSKVEKNDVYTKSESDGKISSAVNTAKSEIKQTTDSITSSVSSLDTKVNNISVGGRNLLRYTKDFSIGWGYFQNVSKVEVVDDSRFGKALEATSDGNATSRNPALRNTIMTDVIGGQEMTLSLWIKRETAGTISQLFKFRDANNNESNPISGIETTVAANTWYYYTHTFIVPTSAVQMYLTPRIVTSEASKKFSIAQPKLELGNKATDWSPAPEDVDAGIQTVDSKTSAVNQKADSIRSDVTSLSGTVSGHTSTLSAQSTSIEQLNSSITSKAEKTSVYTKAEAEGKISSAVSTAKSEIKQTTDSITSSVTATNTKIDNIQIGGRNLFQNSATFDKYRIGSDNSNTSGFAKSVSDANGAYNVITFPNSGNIYFYPNMAAKRLAGKTYTISLEIRTTKALKGYWYAGDGANHYSTLSFPNTNNVWKRWSFTYDQLADDIGDKLFGFQGAVAGDVISFRKLKLEEGSKSSDWTPAPEDIDANISNSIETAKSEIKQTTDSITQSVTATNTKIDNIQVGSRNLLFHTDQTFTASVTGNTFVAAGGTLKDAFTRDNQGLLLEKGQTYTLQYEYSISNYKSGVGFGLGSGTVIGDYNADTFQTVRLYDLYGGASGKVVYTFTYNSSEIRYLAFRPMRVQSGNDSNTMTISISKLKVEKGNKPTDYTIAPEDIDTNISSAVSTAKSEIKQTTDSITSSVTATNKKIDNIQVGGRNLIRNSNFAKGFELWGIGTPAATQILTSFFQGNNAIQTVVSSGYADVIQYINNISPKTEYTFSANLGGAVKIYLVEYKADGTQTATYKDNYHYYPVQNFNGLTPRISFTFTTQADTDKLRLFFRVEKKAEESSTGGRAANLKLELGNMPTDYTIAPEDIDANIAESISTAKSEIKQTTDSITSSVTATNTKIDNLQIGGRNFVRNGDLSQDFSKAFWSNWGITNADKSIVNITDLTGFKQAAQIQVPNLNRGISQFVGLLSAGTYTMSGWLKSTDTGKDYLQLSVNTNGMYSYYSTPRATTSWSRLVKTFTLDAPANVTLQVGRGSGSTTVTTLLATGLKIESGSYATDWSQNPDDVDASIVDAISTAKSEIKQTTDSITSSVSSTNTRIDNISVGGRNLARYSGNFIDTKGWGLNGTSGTLIEPAVVDGLNVIHAKGSIAGTQLNMPYLKPNTDYVYSMEIKLADAFTATSNTPAHFWLGTSAGGSHDAKATTKLISPASIPANTWTKVVILTKTKVNLPSGIYFRPFIYGLASSASEYWLKNIKFEEGSIPTDWSPSPDDVNERMDNIQIGGRNKILNSSFKDGMSNWSSFSSTISVVDDSSSPTGKAVHIVGQNDNGGIWYSASKLAPNGMETGKEYTLSIIAKGSGALEFGIERLNSTSRIDLTSNYTKYTVTQFVSSSQNVIFYTKSGAEAYIHSIKLEEGNRATEWTAAGEDIDSSINSINSTLSTQSSSITQLKNSITSKVEKSDVYTKSETDGKISSSVSAAKSEIKQTTDGITSSVTATNTKIDNIKIGGRNLAKDSKYSELSPKDTGQSADNYNYKSFYVGIVKGQEYTVSFGVEQTAGTAFNVITVYEYPGGKTFDAPIVDGKVFYTFTSVSDTSDRVLLYAGKSGSTRGNGAIFREVMIENSNKKSEWMPAPEDVDSRASSIDQKADSIQSSVNSLSSTVSSHGTTINAHTSSINQLNNSITSKVEKNDVYTKSEADGKISSAVSTAKSQIKQTTDAIESTVSSVSTKVDNISVGGRNLVLGSSTPKTGTGTGGTNQNTSLYSIDFSPLAGKEVTISFDHVSTVNSGTGIIQWNNTPWGSLSGSFPVSTTKKHFVKTVTQPTDGLATGVQLRLDNVTGSVTISNLKIELGNIATDYTPAPEDIDSSISGINSTLSKQSSSISQLNNAITSKVEKTDVYTKSESDGKISSAVSSAKTEIKQTTDSITSSVSNVKQDVADSSQNIVRNTSFLNNLDYWSVSAGVIDSSKAVDGNNAVKIEVSGQTGDVWRGIISNGINVGAGQTYNASIYAYADDLSLDTSGSSYYLEVEWFNAAGTRLSTSRVQCKPSSVNNWQRFNFNVKAPANTVKATFRAYVQRNGRMWVSRPMFVLGDKMPSSYSPMPADTALTDMNTQINQTANEVSTNVVKKGNVVTSINASSEGVRIKGDKIDISGAVTFSSLNPDMQGKVNAGTSAMSAFNNLDVGGTNMLTGTNFDSLSGFYRWGSGTFNNVTNDSFVGFNYLQIETKDASGNGLTVSKGTAIGIQTNGHTFRVIKGRQYTVSMIIATSELDGVLDYCYLMHGNGSNSYSLPNVNTYDFPYVIDVSSGSPATRGYYKVSYTFTADVTDDKAYILVGGRTTRDLNASAGYAWIRISQLQVEEGNKATSWSPSPVDVAQSLVEGKLYIRGTGMDRSANRLLRINDREVYNLNGRGLRLTTIDRSTLATTFDQTYDVYSGATARQDLASKLNSLSDDVIVTVTSYDAIHTGDGVADALARCGGSGVSLTYRNPYALIGVPTIGKGAGIEVYFPSGGSSPYAEISTRVEHGVPVGINTSSLKAINDAQSTADSAVSKANSAQSSANSAQSTANSATSKANSAQSTADSAQAAANSAKSDIADMSSDGKITPIEKVQLKKEWATIVAEKTTLYNMGSTFGKTSERDAFNTSYNNLNTLLNGTGGVLTNMSSTSTVTGSTFRNTFDDYYDKKAILIKVTSETSRSLANNAQSSANSAQSTANTATSKADSAQSTANTANSTANYAKSTVDNGKSSWSSAYSLTQTWRRGNTTEIDGGNISTQSIQAKSMVMADFTNLCENPDFEGDAPGANPMGFNPQGNFRVVDISQYSYTNGSNRALWIDASSTGNSDAYVSNLIPVSKGQQFYVGAEGRYYNGNGTGYGRIGFRRYDAKRQPINTWDSVAWWTGSKNQNFNYQSGTYTVADGCSYLQIWISFANNGTTNNSFIIDNIRVHRMANAELIVDGIIEGRHIKADSITFDKAKGGTLKLGGTGNENGVLEVYSSEGELIANLDGDKGGFTSLYVADFDSPSVVEYGDANLNFYVSDRWLDYSGAVDPSDENSGNGWAQPLATIGEALRRIPKFNDGSVTINLPYSGVFYENVDILGYLGTGSITISGGNGVRINGNIRAYKTLNNVYFKNFTLNGTAGSYGNIQIAQSPYVNAENVYVYGNNSQRAFDVRENAYAQISNCEMYDVDYGINSRYGATTYVYNCKGLGAVCGLYAYGGYIVGKGTAPGGTKYASAQTGDGGTINSTFTYNLGSAAPPPVPETTKSFSSSSGNSWRDNFSGQWYNQGIVAQGYWGGYGVYRGLWFFGTSLSDTVKGKTIKSMRMYVKRTTSGGNSGAVTCYFKSHNYTGQPSGAPSLGSSYTTATFKWGEGKWINIPSAMWSDFTSGTAKGIGIYINSTSQNYYARFGTSATIEVTYK